MSYNLQKSYQFIKNQSMASTFTSPVQEIERQDNEGIQMNWTGSPVGTFDVQVSIDYLQDIEGNVQNPGNWISIPLSPVISAAGSAGSAFFDLNQLTASYMRVVYTAASGTGVLNGYVTGKGV